MKFVSLMFLSAVSFGVPTQCPQEIEASFSDFELKTSREIQSEYEKETFVNEELLKATLLARDAAKDLKQVKELLTLTSAERETCEYESDNSKVTALISLKSKHFLCFHEVEKDRYNVSFSVVLDQVTPEGLGYNASQEPKIYSAGKIVYGFVYGKARKFSLKFPKEQY